MKEDTVVNNSKNPDPYLCQKVQGSLQELLMLIVGAKSYSEGLMEGTDNEQINQEKKCNILLM